jgi:superfamily II DNA or RNA helicase
MRLLCAPELLEEDFAAIRRGLELREAVNQAVLREIEKTLQHPLTRPRLELLANLVANGNLDVRFIARPDQSGIFHDKVGIFSDREGDTISFTGSINETWRAWHPLGNHESFEVFSSWGSEASRVTDHQTYFQSLWLAREPHMEVFAPDDLVLDSLLRFADPDPLEALKRPRSPHEGPPRRLFDHQSASLADWRERGRRGILKHATGSGKTLTALHGAADWLAENKPVLVIVPSTLLLEQWLEEIDMELGFMDPSVVAVGGGHEDWRKKGLLTPHIAPEGGPRVTVATMQTACTDGFLSRVKDPSALLLIADEVHRLGATEYGRVMEIAAPARLGLSATPERAGDRAGTERLFSYFGPVLDPEFSIRDAIDAGRLCPYEYRPATVALTLEEEDAWIAQTKKIQSAYAQEADDIARGGMSDYLKHLLIRRARIAKKAHLKETSAVELIVREARPEHHWLVYCEDRSQLAAILGKLRDIGVDAMEYHSSMEGDQQATLDRFRREGGVLVSIRCLDEGVDIPSVSHALILASSRNYRQFVQRRGRVLRVAPGKHHATLFDLLVLPASAGREEAFDGLVLGEILRARVFAQDALNYGALGFLKAVCIRLGLDEDNLLRNGLEDDAMQGSQLGEDGHD